MTVIVTFDDSLAILWAMTDENGSFIATLDVPISEPSVRTINVSSYVHRSPHAGPSLCRGNIHGN